MRWKRRTNELIAHPLSTSPSLSYSTTVTTLTDSPGGESGLAHQRTLISSSLLRDVARRLETRILVSRVHRSQHQRLLADRRAVVHLRRSYRTELMEEIQRMKKRAKELQVQIDKTNRQVLSIDKMTQHLEQVTLLSPDSLSTLVSPSSGLKQKESSALQEMQSVGATLMMEKNKGKEGVEAKRMQED